MIDFEEITIKIGKLINRFKKKKEEPPRSPTFCFNKGNVCEYFDDMFCTHYEQLIENNQVTRILEAPDFCRIND